MLRSGCGSSRRLAAVRIKTHKKSRTAPQQLSGYKQRTSRYLISYNKSLRMSTLHTGGTLCLVSINNRRPSTFPNLVRTNILQQQQGPRLSAIQKTKRRKHLHVRVRTKKQFCDFDSNDRRRIRSLLYLLWAGPLHLRQSFLFSRSDVWNSHLRCRSAAR